MGSIDHSGRGRLAPYRLAAEVRELPADGLKALVCLDATHSTVGFAVKHMGIANVRGQFAEFEGTLEVDEDLASSSARGSVKVASITTGEEQRDAHLRSEDFFNAEELPEMLFSRPWLRRSMKSPRVSSAT